MKKVAEGPCAIGARCPDCSDASAWLDEIGQDHERLRARFEALIEQLLE